MQSFLDRHARTLTRVLLQRITFGPEEGTPGPGVVETRHWPQVFDTLRKMPLRFLRLEALYELNLDIVAFDAIGMGGCKDCGSMYCHGVNASVVFDCQHMSYTSEHGVVPENVLFWRQAWFHDYEDSRLPPAGDITSSDRDDVSQSDEDDDVTADGEDDYISTANDGIDIPSFCSPLLPMIVMTDGASTENAEEVASVAPSEEDDSFSEEPQDLIVKLNISPNVLPQREDSTATANSGANGDTTSPRARHNQGRTQ